MQSDRIPAAGRVVVFRCRVPEKTEWHRVVFWGRQAEVLSNHATKGTKLYVEGQLETRKWQDQNGQDRFTTEIRGRNFQFLSKSSDGNQGTSSQSGSDAQRQNTPPQGTMSGNQHGDTYEDDIPF